MGYAHGVRWDDELIKEKVMEVVKGLGIDRMPSLKECKEYFGNSGLTNAISRRYGWYRLAKMLNLEIKRSETQFGKKYENQMREKLINLGFEVQQMTQNHPYDLLINKCIKADVKTSHLYKGRTGLFYTFNLEKECATCDFFILLPLDDFGNPVKVLIVPSNKVMFNNQISIGKEKSKYHVYHERYDLILRAIEFWDSISEDF